MGRRTREQRNNDFAARLEDAQAPKKPEGFVFKTFEERQEEARRKKTLTTAELRASDLAKTSDSDDGKINKVSDEADRRRHYGE